MSQEKVESRQVEDLFLKGERRSIRPWHRRITVVPFGITDMKIQPAQAHTGDTVVISFKATNSTGFISIYPVVLKINEEVIAAEVVSLPHKTVMLMEFQVRRTVPGKYNVAVNDSTGRFIVVGSSVENEIARLEGVKPDLSILETDIDIHAERQIKRDQPKEFTISSVSGTSGKSRSAIDKIGSGIEFGLDKLGDAIIFSIEVVIRPFIALFRLLRRNKGTCRRN